MPQTTRVGYSPINPGALSKRSLLSGFDTFSTFESACHKSFFPIFISFKVTFMKLLHLSSHHNMKLFYLININHALVSNIQQLCILAFDFPRALILSRMICRRMVLRLQGRFTADVTINNYLSKLDFIPSIELTIIYA